MKRTRLLQIIKEEVANALNEMPYLSGEKGKDLRDALKAAVDNLSSQGLDNKQIASVLKSKKKRAELAPGFAAALEDQFEKYGDEPKYNPDLGGPQTQRAVDQELGLSEPGKRGRKAKSDDESTPSTTPEPTPPGKRGRKKGSKNLDLTSLLSPTPEEEPEEEPVGSEDEEWYGTGDEDDFLGPSDEELRDIESSLEDFEDEF